MYKFLLTSLFFVSASLITVEEESRECDDILVDDVTDMAFADQGQPFSGKVNCYYDKEKKKLKSERIFVEGIPTGSHHCYRWSGKYNYSIIVMANGIKNRFS